MAVVGKPAAGLVHRPNDIDQQFVCCTDQEPDRTEQQKFMLYRLDDIPEIDHGTRRSKLRAVFTA
jgi:hypothetical protein